MKLRHRVVVEVQYGHYTVLEVAMRHSSLLRQRHRFGRFGPEDETQCIGIVNGDVQNDPGAARRFGQAPTLQMGRQVDGVKDSGVQRAADCAGLDQFTDFLMGGGIAKVMVGAHHDAGIRAGSNHFPGVPDVKSQRLFAQDVFARCRGG